MASSSQVCDWRWNAGCVANTNSQGAGSVVANPGNDGGINIGIPENNGGINIGNPGSSGGIIIGNGIVLEDLQAHQNAFWNQLQHPILLADD